MYTKKTVSKEYSSNNQLNYSSKTPTKTPLKKPSKTEEPIKKKINKENLDKNKELKKKETNLNDTKLKNYINVSKEVALKNDTKISNDNNENQKELLNKLRLKDYKFDDKNEDFNNIDVFKQIDQNEFKFINNEIDLDRHCQDKLDKLTFRLEKLQKKYSSYKIWYDRLNIMIIVISSILSVTEAMRNELIHLTENNKTWEFIFNITPLSISTFITGTAAIIQFQKYQEKMENMQFTKEKVILAVSKIKHIQEMILFHDNFEDIKKKYFEDIYGFYNESNSEIERQLMSDATEELKFKEKIVKLKQQISESEDIEKKNLVPELNYNNDSD